jgi:hypothetical protein
MNSDRRKRFVLQAVDEQTGTPCLEALLWIADVAELRPLLADEAEDDPELRRSYELAPDQLRAVGRLAEPPFSPDERLHRLDPWHSNREAPYLIHTGYELALMMERRKSLTFFHDVFPADWLDEIMSRFDPFVARGKFVRRIVDEPLSAHHPLAEADAGDTLRTILIALSDQAWRIDAFLLMWRVAAITGWNETLERFEGSLLGYEDWQNDWWIEHTRGRSTRADPSCAGPT